MTIQELRTMGMPDGITFSEGKFLIVNGGGHTETIETDEQHDTEDDEPLWPIEFSKRKYKEDEKPTFRPEGWPKGWYGPCDGCDD
jgi:hypothetical protein